jgi:hypothetical protein
MLMTYSPVIGVFLPSFLLKNIPAKLTLIIIHIISIAYILLTPPAFWHVSCSILGHISRKRSAMKTFFLYIVCGLFLLAAFAFAADKPATESTKTAKVKTNVVKTANMNARGKVIEISDEAIVIERAVRGKVEKIKFELNKPVENIAANDFVSIAYTQKDGKLLASRITKTGVKKDQKAAPANK